MLKSYMISANGQTHPWCNSFDFNRVVLATTSAVLGPLPLFMQGCAVCLLLINASAVELAKIKKETFFSNHNKARNADTQTAAQQINRTLQLCYRQALGRSLFLYFKDKCKYHEQHELLLSKLTSIPIFHLCFESQFFNQKQKWGETDTDGLHM